MSYNRWLAIQFAFLPSGIPVLSISRKFAIYSGGWKKFDAVWNFILQVVGSQVG